LQLNADIIAVTEDDTIMRVVYLNSNQTLQSFTVTYNPWPLGMFDHELATLNVTLPHTRFAATTAKTMSKRQGQRDVYVYYQENGTHLAEISIRQGFWRTMPVYIQIP
jgi:hypothetical protein